ncbi:MAG: 2-oxo acid dehydrogenase subunit E2 [Dehalococcoidia bacterium]
MTPATSAPAAAAPLLRLPSPLHAAIRNTAYSVAEPAPEPPATAVATVEASTAPPAPCRRQQRRRALDGWGARPFASPSVRRLAREIGVDLIDNAGDGPGGALGRRREARGPRVAAAVSWGRPRRVSGSVPTGGIEVPPLPDFAQAGPVEREPLTRFRRTVARNMATSWAIIAYTLHRWVDVTELEALRQRYKQRAADAGGSLTVTVILLKIVAAALKAHPRMNASIDLDAGELVLKKHYDIGVAVDTPRGLTVPVVRGVDDKNIIELSVELQSLAERARAGELTVEEMRGGTFTLTNLGGMGIGEFTPIINWPEVGVLGVGRAEQQPAWVNEAWQPRLRMPLSLSHDHRVIDGADGARFLTWIEEAIAEPLLIALEG